MIQEGSVVYLKSGGPRVIVNTIVGEKALCAWITVRKRYETGEFHLCGLTLEETLS